MSHAFGETITLVSRTVTGQDAYGNDIYGNASTVLNNITIAPRDGNGTSGNELVQGQDLVIIGLTVFLPDGVNAESVDRVVCRGATWEIDGEAQFYVNPFTGHRPGTPIALSRATG